MNKSKFSAPVIIALIVGLLLGFAAGAYTYRDGGVGLGEGLEDEELLINDEGETEDEDGSIVTSSTGEKNGNGGVAFAVAADQVAGNMVKVDRVSFDKVAWIAVKNYEGQTLGNVMGAYRLPAGTFLDVGVELVKPTVAGGDYALVAFYDNGDLAFSSQTDTLIEKDGKPLMQAFSVK